MTELLHDPFIQSSLLPLALALLAVGVLHRLWKPLAAAAVGAVFLGVFALVVGVPALPPPSSVGKLFWASAAGLALGTVLDLAGVKGRAGAAVLALWLVAALVWIALPALDGLTAGVTLAVLAAGGVAFLFGSGAGAAGPVGGASLLLALSLAIGGTALIGSSASIAQMALALAAATGGFLLWNWPVARHVWGQAGRAALGVAVLLAAVLALFTQTQAAVLLLTLPAVLAGRVRLPLPDTAVGRAAGAAVVTVVTLIPALAAIAAAYALSGGEPSPY